MLFLGIQKNIFTFIRIFLFGDGGNFARIFAFFFFKIVNLHLDGYFVSVLFTDTKILSIFFSRTFFLAHEPSASSHYLYNVYKPSVAFD